MSGTYVLGDWGTTNLRLFRFAEGEPIARFDAPGVGALDESARRILAEQLAMWKAKGPITDVTLCGMAGARGGLVEAMHVDCPAGLIDWRGHATRLMIEDVRVSVVPGLRCWDERGVPDVMRGEETQIFGAMSIDPSLAEGHQCFVSPGTHSKWVRVEDGVIQGFRTSPTGELYSLLNSHSTLVTRTVAGKGDFNAGFERGLARGGEPTLAALFEARAGQLLDSRSSDWAKGYLSGLLIGNEVASQVSGTTHVTLIGDPKLCALYARALDGAACQYRTIEGDAAVLAGLRVAKGNAA